MKPGRNDPCPCGSGKKYKKCCYFYDSDDIDNLIDCVDDEEDSIDAESLFRAFTSFRKLTLDKKRHIKEYYKIRNTHSEIVGAMIKYYEDGKYDNFLPSDNIPDHILSADNEKVYTDFDLTTDLGSNAFYDLLIYRSIAGAPCIAEEFLRKKHYRKTNKIEFLHSMINSKAGLFEIIDTDSHDAYVTVRDVFTGEVYTIIDVALSGEISIERFYLYTRIINYNSISFGTGFCLPFLKSDKYIQKFIRKCKKDFKTNEQNEHYRFAKLYSHYTKSPNSVGFITNTIN